MLSILTSLALSFLPSRITHLLVPYLSIFFPFIFPPASPGSPAAIRNYRIAFTGVVLTWQAYSFFSKGDSDISWYSLLGVSKFDNDYELKKAFRKLARLHHPDVAGPGKIDDDLFIYVRKAYETLLDPTKRYAYDRFGPHILNWKVTELQDYLLVGLQQSTRFYILSGGIMLVMSLLGRAKAGRFWVHLLFATLLYLELALILYPTISPRHFYPLRFLPRSFLAQPQFLQIEFLHRVFTALSITVTQLAGAWSNRGIEEARKKKDDQEFKAVVAEAMQLDKASSDEFFGHFTPLIQNSPNPQLADYIVRRALDDTMFQFTLANRPDIRHVYAMARSRAMARFARRGPPGAPHGGPHPATEVPGRTPAPSGLGQKRKRDMDSRLAVAVKTPLPPSPPASPVLGPKRTVRRQA
ncbi:hypothetical protein IAT38_007733 [Cryptococcus sp. DSM 104549]